MASGGRKSVDYLVPMLRVGTQPGTLRVLVEHQDDSHITDAERGYQAEYLAAIAIAMEATMNYTTAHPPPIIYAICCTSRSGSTYLCELLSSTERLGQPGEYFNTAAIDRWKHRLGLSSQATHSEYFDRLLEAFTTSDTFGVKTVPEALQRMETIISPTHYIWLRRRDTLRQAISLYRASRSGTWHRRSELRDTTAVPFDRQSIERVRGWIDGANQHWQTRFAAETRPTLRLWYEQVCEHPQNVVEQIARFLERPLPEGIVAQATTQVMRDELTEYWVRRCAA